LLFGDDPDVLELRQRKGALKAQAMKWVRLVEMTRDAFYWDLEGSVLLPFLSLFFFWC
jgi:hypothetical protein